MNPKGNEVKPIIMNTDENAAIYRTDIRGWVSKNGNFWGSDEKQARWDGCTHIACDGCGEPVEKLYTYCRKCRLEREIARYNAKERRAWDGYAMLYSEASGEYFDNLEMAEESLEEEGETLADLRLVICEPIYLRPIDEDYWADPLADDGELPEAVKAALKALNLAISEAGPVSWEPEKFAVDLDAVTVKGES